MLLLGLLLLLLALTGAVLGLVTAAGIWFVGSLVASALAGYLLWRQREQTAARTGVHKDQSAPKTSARPTSLVTGTAFSAATRTEDSSAAATQDVWVVDGKPQFHTRGCSELGADRAEPVPYAQAVEDGFTECARCKPAVSSSRTAQVWVVDGRPDYHAEGCRTLKTAAVQGDTEAEQIPRAQAVEDGFTPCPDCRPDGAAPAAATAPPATGGSAAPAGTVWVVDGRPRYHLQDCLTIKGQPAEAIPREQADEDGFMPCSMCEPATTRV